MKTLNLRIAVDYKVKFFGIKKIEILEYYDDEAEQWKPVERVWKEQL